MQTISYHSHNTIVYILLTIIISYAVVLKPVSRVLLLTEPISGTLWMKILKVQKLCETLNTDTKSTYKNVDNCVFFFY